MNTRTPAADDAAEQRRGRTTAAANRRWLVAMAGVALAGFALLVFSAGLVVATTVFASIAVGVVASRIHLFLGMRDRFDAISYLTNEAVVVVDRDYSFAYVSPSVEHVLGYSPKEYAKLRAGDLIHPDDLDAAGAASASVRNGSAPTFRFVGRFRHRDGRWRWIEVSGRNLLDDPKVRGVVNTLRDVTDRVEAAEALRASHNRFHALVANSNDILIVLDRHGRATFASPAVGPNLGMNPDDLIGVDLVTLAHPADADYAAALFEKVRSQPGGAANFEVRALRSDGRYIHVDVRLQNLLDDPAVEGVVLHGRDVTARRQAERALRESENRFRSLAASAPIGIFELDADGKVLYVNDRFREISGLTPSQVERGEFLATIHPDDRRRVASEWTKAIARGIEYRGRFRVVHPDGTVHQVVGQTSPIHDGDPSNGGVVGTIMDVTDLVDARQNASRFQSIIENTSDLVVITDGSGRPQYFNRAARRAMGISSQVDISSLSPGDFLAADSFRRFVEEALPAALERGLWSGELELVRPSDGSSRPVSQVLLASRDEHGAIEFLASISRDMSEQKELEARLQYQADHDELTGLPNRKPLINYLEVALANAHRFGGKVAVLFLDIDRFKIINDSLGHHAGDQVLHRFARRLASAIRPHDRAGRFGGDEFVVICPGVATAAEVHEIADRVRRDVAGRLTVGGDEIYVTVSIGVAIGTGGASPIDLLRDADAAMYEAKARGRDRVQVFDGGLRLQLVERLDIERELRRALERDELELHYQPVVDLSSGRVRGVEALVRWRHPERGLLFPKSFLPVAEETGLVVEIGDWVLRRACAEASDWDLDPVSGEVIPVYINLSARQLVDAGLVDHIREVIDLTGVEPAAVHLEITENALLGDALTTRSVLLRLRELGVRLALDDFGTGFSSLSYLKHFPVDALKIDKTFVDGLGRDSGDAAITAAIVDVAQRLGLSTVAEGVERDDQAEWLAALGCDLAQGYHFARPMTAEELRRRFDDERSGLGDC